MCATPHTKSHITKRHIAKSRASCPGLTARERVMGDQEKAAKREQRKANVAHAREQEDRRELENFQVRPDESESRGVGFGAGEWQLRASGIEHG